MQPSGADTRDNCCRFNHPWLTTGRRRPKPACELWLPPLLFPPSDPFPQKTGRRRDRTMQTTGVVRVGRERASGAKAALADCPWRGRRVEKGTLEGTGWPFVERQPGPCGGGGGRRVGRVGGGGRWWPCQTEVKRLGPEWSSVPQTVWHGADAT